MTNSAVNEPVNSGDMTPDPTAEQVRKILDRICTGGPIAINFRAMQCDSACSTAPLGEDLRCTLALGHTTPKHAVIANGRLLAQWLDAVPEGSYAHAAFSRGRITTGVAPAPPRPTAPNPGLPQRMVRPKRHWWSRS